jgi:alginate O-acetyltransferase complex protein AlgI
MLFNSGTFLQFFAAVLLLYYIVRNHLTSRNVLLVLASYTFYGWWDYRFLSLLLISSVLDYTVGLGLDHLKRPTQRKVLVTLSILGNLTILGFFKYYGFFVKSLASLLNDLGVHVHLQTLELVLPVGISFYTFQTMSYAIDVYRREIVPTRNLLQFLAYVSFFPQLVAGPIERSKHLLPQFSETKRITAPMVQEGIWLCVWGLFKKVVLADNLAPLVEMVYDHPKPGALLVALATLAFGSQIYCDFSGYSDIARGTARLLGFDLVLNFNLPYLSTNLREFWRRWHISLSTWLRDYLYISLGGNRRGTGRTFCNLFVTMLLGGLWHGAAWNFVAWGAWHGAGLAVHRLWASSPRPSERSGLAGHSPRQGQPLICWLVTFLFVFYGWLLFRAGSWQRIVLLTKSFGDLSLLSWTANYCFDLALFIVPLLGMEVWQSKTKDLLAPLRLPLWGRAALQGTLLVTIILFWEKEKMPFIYFQF